MLITIKLCRELVNMLDDIARRKGTDRSKVIREALIEYVMRHRNEG